METTLLLCLIGKKKKNSFNTSFGVCFVLAAAYGMQGGVPGDSDGKEFAYKVGDLGLIPGWGRSPGGGHGNPLQYSCLENPQE